MPLTRHSQDKMRKRRQESAATAARAHGEDALQLGKPSADSSSSTAAATTTSISDQGALAAFVSTATPAVLAALVLGVYVKTLYPSVAGGDSGELVAESCHLGVSHPPGYPLFNMAVHAFALLLPWGHGDSEAMTVAWRANLFSAGKECSLSYQISCYSAALLLRMAHVCVVCVCVACDAMAAVVIYYCILHWTRDSGRFIRHIPAFTAAVRTPSLPLASL